MGQSISTNLGLLPLVSAARSYCRQLALAIFLLAAVNVANAVEQSPTFKACIKNPSDLAGLTVDASTDVRATESFSETTNQMLHKEQFDSLDCLADSLRASKAKFAGGMWELHSFYLGLAWLEQKNEDQWTAQMSLLKKWSEKKPKSITAHVALAELYRNWAWEARGDTYSDKVSENGWKLFESRNQEALRILEEASKLPDKCPEWYLAMQQVTRSLDWDDSARRALFEKAIKFEPGYYYFYRTHAFYILPRWGGDEGESKAFVERQADRLGGDAGDILYYQMAVQLVCGCEEDREVPLSWPRIQKGFAALEKQSGVALEVRNAFAHIAMSFHDAPVADKMFNQIGEQWSENVWSAYSYFDRARQWARTAAPVMQRTNGLEDSAAENLKTPEGQHYNSEFAEIVRSWMQPCLAETDAANKLAFELLLQVGKEGTIENVTGRGLPGALMHCLGQKLQEMRISRQPVLPRPPVGDYWVRFDFVPDLPAAAQVK